jgi:hypothetical protein
MASKKPQQDSHDSRRQHQRVPKGGRADGYGGMPRPKPPAQPEPKPGEQK